MALRVPYLPPRLSTVLVMPRPRTRKRLIVRDLLPGVINVMHIEGPVEGREAHAVFGKPAGCNHMGRLKNMALRGIVWAIFGHVRVQAAYMSGSSSAATLRPAAHTRAVG